MASVTVRTNLAAVKRKLTALRRAATPAAQNAIMQRLAWVWHGRMVLRTPKRWTGQTRRSWKVQKVAHGFRLLGESKVLVYLEKGTRAHGPRTARSLFIPLTRKAALAGSRGVVAELQAAREQERRPRFIAGRDFIFTKRVRGIKARWMVRSALPFMRTTHRMALEQFIRYVISVA